MSIAHDKLVDESKEKRSADVSIIILKASLSTCLKKHHDVS